MTQEHIRVVVADDHPSVRENLRYLIDAETDLECIGVVKDGRRCIEMCRQLQPDVLVVDGNIPGPDGVAIALTVGRLLPRVGLVMYTLDTEMCALARSSGARVGCVPKDAPYEYLVRSIRQAAPNRSAAA